MIQHVREGLAIYKAELLLLIDEVNEEADNAFREKRKVNIDLFQKRFLRLKGMEDVLELLSHEVQAICHEIGAPRTKEEIERTFLRRFSV